jgi:hypothetical protein
MLFNTIFCPSTSNNSLNDKRQSVVSQATISDIRLQKNNSVKLKTLYEIADGLELGLNDFFDSPLFERENLMD